MYQRQSIFLIKAIIKKGIRSGIVGAGLLLYLIINTLILFL